MDSLSNVRRIKCPTIADDHVKESLDIPVFTGISDDEVVLMIEFIAAFRSNPGAMRMEQNT